MFKKFINFKETSMIIEALEATGMALIGGLKSIEDIASLSKKIGTVIKHRDSSHPSGVITLRPTVGVERETFKGFSRKEQYLHTDGTMVTQPCDVVSLMCEKQSAKGGESIFMDAKKLYNTLQLREPDLLDAMFEMEAAVFGEASDGILKKPIFKKITDKLVTISFRYDKLVTFSEKVQRRLPSLIDLMDVGMMTIKLKPGQGYVLNNHRFIHGRRKFYGDRIIHRAQIHIKPSSSIPLGFQVDRL